MHGRRRACRRILHPAPDLYKDFRKVVRDTGFEHVPPNREQFQNKDPVKSNGWTMTIDRTFTILCELNQPHPMSRRASSAIGCSKAV